MSPQFIKIRKNTIEEEENQNDQSYPSNKDKNNNADDVVIIKNQFKVEDDAEALKENTQKLGNFKNYSFKMGSSSYE